ncbi:hypothetical protein D3C84_995570 [compost metagenome]
MSIGAVPPELVKRSRSRVNKLELRFTRGKASCMAARNSQCTLQSNPSSKPAWAKAQLPVHTPPIRFERRAWARNQTTCSRVTAL